MKHALKFLPAMVLAFAPAMAGAWWAINRHEVFVVSDGVFEVLNEVGSGAVDYWCGAGDYARRQLRAAATQRIYIWKAIGPSATHPGKKSVQFSFSAPEGASTSPGYSLSVKAVGDNLTTAAAYQYCIGDDPFDAFRPRGF